MSDTERLADPWLEDIVRCGEVALARWQEAHRNEETLALTFVGPDGPFYGGIRSVVERLRDYHFERTRGVAPSPETPGLASVDAPRDALLRWVREKVETMPGWRDPRYSGQYESVGLIDRESVLAVLDDALHAALASPETPELRKAAEAYREMHPCSPDHPLRGCPADQALDHALAAAETPGLREAAQAVVRWWAAMACPMCLPPSGHRHHPDCAMFALTAALATKETP